LISNYFGDSVSGSEKAGVGGSIPSLATIKFNNLELETETIRFQRSVRRKDQTHISRCMN